LRSKYKLVAQRDCEGEILFVFFLFKLNQKL